MADEENEDLQMAIHMSMQHPSCSLPDPKRSKPRDDAVPRLSSADESPEVKNRRLQRERMAEAAEKRMMMAKSTISAALISKAKEPVGKGGETGLGERAEEVEGGRRAEDGNLGRELTATEAGHLFSMVFGASASRAILAQWTNQGVRFSPDPETSIGLVQHEGGPCGVLAAIQAFVLKYLIFFPEELGRCEPNVPQNLGLSKKSESRSFAWNKFICPSEERKLSALIRSMVEMLFLCGSNRRAVIATLSILSHDTWQLADGTKYEIVGNVLEGLSIESASDLQKILRVSTYTSQAIAFQRVQAMIPIFESRMGALLFLISALLSRGLDSVQGDRDDPNPPLVTAPFGHASQEIVNLLLCGQAVPNVFDGRMDLGGGMFLKGVSTRVEVGFLTLLESLNFCKVGQNLKHPNWPIWVVGSESHYTVLFALDTSAQDENELEKRESRIREAFDAQDQSGGGGFISVEGLHQVLREMAICLPTEKLDHLSSTGFIVWSEFWQALLDLDKSDGGLRDSTGLMGKKVFDLYHFNGIAKSILNGGTSGGETPVQRPRLAQLRVSVPPRWSLEEYMAKPESDSSGKETIEVANPEPVQHAPLVDCIRTRWPRAVCNWVGDPPSIV